MEILYEEEGNGFIGLSWEANLKVWILHIDCKEWSVATFKRYKKIAEVVLSDLKDRGITEVYGLCKDKKAIKFNQKFGAVLTPIVVEDEDGVMQAVVRKIL